MRTLLMCLFLSGMAYGQYRPAFEAAYAAHPLVPKGVLESVAWTNTRMQPIPTDQPESCSGMPLPYGILGLIAEGKNYFLENGKTIGKLSGIDVSAQKASVDAELLAFAAAFEYLFIHLPEQIEETAEARTVQVLHALSELPEDGLVNMYARDAQLFSILTFLNDDEMAQRYNFQPWKLNLKKVFGENFNILSAKKVTVTPDAVKSTQNDVYQPKVGKNKSLQYGPAIWNPAATCNFSSRNGIAVSAITIHTIQGTYAGAISWAQNCNSSVSYHYVVRSSDGQITQMVLEENKAWHVGSENGYTIGYEHEGYVSNPIWYTEELYEASADLSKDIINSGYGIPAARTYYGQSSSSVQNLGGCTKIKGHQHYPNQTHTDPGIFWNWEKYYRLINDNPNIQTITSSTGTLYDSGGANGNYTNDERLLWLIQPANSGPITLSFSQFSIENGFDRLFIYDGNSVNAPLIGSYTGSSIPSTIQSSTGSILLEFRSDCGTTGSGWALSYSSTPIDLTAPNTSIVGSGNWETADFDVNFIDNDNSSGVAGKFYLCADRPNNQSGWKSNMNRGFLFEDFQDNADDWTVQTGNFNLQGNAFIQSDFAGENTNAHIPLAQIGTKQYVYEWKQTITSAQSNQRAGIHFFCSDPTLPNRGNSYFVYFREGQNKVQIYSVDNDTYTIQTNDTCVVLANTTYTFHVWYDPQSGWIRAYINNELVSYWQDPTPLQSGSFFSLRSGGCAVRYDDIRCYSSRGSTTTIELGEDMRYQSDAGQDAGTVLAYSIDGQHNWSPLVSYGCKIDWTAPESLFIADGQGQDIDSTLSQLLNGNWSASDPHSGVIGYSYALGTSAGGTDIVNWSTLSPQQSMQHNLVNPIAGTTYYISLKAENTAGLIAQGNSDGQLYWSVAGLSELNGSTLFVYPNPSNGSFTITGMEGNGEITLYSMEGKLISTRELNGESEISVEGIATGNYWIELVLNGERLRTKVIVF